MEEEIKTFAAYYGAVVGSLSLGWAIYSEVTKRRPGIRVRVLPDVFTKYPPDPGRQDNRFVVVEVKNSGQVPIHLNFVSVLHPKSPKTYAIDDRSLPRKLESGDSHPAFLHYSCIEEEGWIIAELIGRADDAIGRVWYSPRRWYFGLVWKLRWFSHNRKLRQERKAKRKVV